MGRAKEQHRLIKLCVANYWLWFAVIVFENTIFFDGRKISRNPKGCSVWRVICIPEENETASPQQVNRKPVWRYSECMECIGGMECIGKLEGVDGPLN